MNPKLRTLATLLGAALLVLGTAGCTAASSTAQGGVLIPAQKEAQPALAVPGMISPNLSLLDYDGVRRQLNDFHGKPVPLNFWASWCGPCRQELPDLAKASRTFQDRVQFVGVNLASQDAQSVSRELLKQSGIAYPNLLDTEGVAADAYGIMVIPTTFLLDAKGKVVEKIQGPLTSDRIEKILQKVK